MHHILQIPKRKIDPFLLDKFRTRGWLRPITSSLHFCSGLCSCVERGFTPQTIKNAQSLIGNPENEFFAFIMRNNIKKQQTYQVCNEFLNYP